MKKLIVRPADPLDIHHIIALTKEIAAVENADFDPSGKSEELSKYLFGKTPRLFCLLAEKEDEIIGMVSYSIEFSLFHARDYLRINSFYIIPANRRQGIGQILMEEIKKEARRLNMKFIRFFTPDFNTGAIKFYKHLGAEAYNAVRFSIKVN